MQIRDALKLGIAQLRDANVQAYTLAAELLLLQAIGKERAWLYAHPEAPVATEQQDHFLSLLARRVAGEPVQHLTGHQEFWGLEFEVNSDVLIPRPETEHLIEVTLDRLGLREVRAGRPQTTGGAGMFLADVGTGSGCIAVALAKELPEANFYASDISQAALALAQRNAARHNLSHRIEFAHNNLLANAKAGNRDPVFFDAIVSNPPYVGRRESASLEREVRDHEPPEALYGGEEGYELYGELIAQSAAHLQSGGLLVLELGHNSLAAVQPLLAEPAWSYVSVTNDLAGIPRIIAAERS
ncbi:MAG: peptide chain release factor N(5)-glutamine methyltransferase [Candidatus Acidiferrum sp.]|jgi:release factor glutamine methyltransferase